MVTTSHMQQTLGTLDSGFIGSLKSMLQHSNSLVQLARDDDARYNALICDAHVKAAG